MKIEVTCCVALCLLIGIPQATSRADLTYGFARITQNSQDNVASQLTVTVSEYSATQVLFTFANSGSVDSIITAVYFDDGTLLSLADLIDADQNGGDDGVDFTQFIGKDTDDPNKVTPPELPGAQDVDPVFETTQGFAADNDGDVAWGVDRGETLGVIFDLQETLTFDDVIAYLADGGLRIGLHVQSIGVDGKSDSYINTPIPAAVLLGVIGLGTAGLKLRRMV